MTAQQIMQMEDAEIIVKHRNLPPIRATRMDWRDHPELKTRRTVPPVGIIPIPDLVSLPKFDADYGQPEPDGEEPAFEPISYENRPRPAGRTIFTNGGQKPKTPRRVD